MEDPTSVYPVLARWLAGSVDGHPVTGLLAADDPGAQRIVAVLEDILAAVERVAPTRVETKLREFRRDVGGFLNLRAELNVGWQLAQSTGFDFGGPGQPDYELADRAGFVEVTTRSRDDLSRLHDELEEALRGRGVVVELRMPRSLVITEAARRAACERVVEVAGRFAGDSVPVALPEVSGSAVVAAHSLFGEVSQVVLDISPDLAGHVEAVERHVLGALSEKVEQAGRGGRDPDTVLVIDASRLGLGWLRPDRVWAGRLEAMELPWASLPFGAVAVVFSDLMSPGFHGSCVARPDLPAPQAARVHQVLAHLGFEKVGH